MRQLPLSQGQVLEDKWKRASEWFSYVVLVVLGRVICSSIRRTTLICGLLHHFFCVKKTPRTKNLV